MFRVMLVDDEPLVRNELKMLLDWERHGFELCGQAQNGLEALSMMEQCSPQIVIIDVHMPEMGGVELNRIIQQRYSSIKTIMLSSFDDYDYVRDCLKNGSVDYLLKHRLEESVLLPVLNRAVQELRQEGHPSGRKPDHSTNEDATNPQLIRDQLLDLLQEETRSAGETKKIPGKHNLYPKASSYVSAAVQIVPFLLLTESYSDVQTNGLVQRVVNMMQQSLGDAQERTAVYIENGRFAIVIASGERSEHAMLLEAEDQLRKISHTLEMFLNLQCITAMGHACNSLFQLASSYRSAVRTLDGMPRVEQSIDHSFLNNIIDPAHAVTDHRQRVSLTIEEHKQLLLCMERFDQVGVNRWIASVFASIRHNPVHSHAVQMIVSELKQIGDKALQAWTQTIEISKDELPSSSELGRLRSVDEMEQWLQSYYACSFNLLKRSRGSGTHSSHVNQAIQFIFEKYAGYVTLELTAGAIGLNSSYLSRIFKEETGRTFSEYLNKVRIDASCTLLQSGKYSFKEISILAGFTTHNYFFKVFKEMTGMTPQSYLNGLGKGEQHTELDDLPDLRHMSVRGKTISVKYVE